jgi:hypothetical protein
MPRDSLFSFAAIYMPSRKKGSGVAGLYTLVML